MKPRFPWGHATHPDWRMAAALCLAQVEAFSRSGGVGLPTLGFLYLTDHYGDQAPDILALMRERTGVAHWVGALGMGIAAGSAEYIDEPAMAVMLADYSTDEFQVFSGMARPRPRDARTPTGRRASWTAMVHGDSSTPDLPELVRDMAHKVASGHLAGGLSSSRHRNTMIADEVLAGGLSGVMLSEDIALSTRITQGCRPIGPVHRVTQASGQLLHTLDNDPALDVLLRDIGVDPDALARKVDGEDEDSRKQQTASTVRMLQGTFIGVGEGDAFKRGDYVVRPLIGVDPGARALAVGSELDLADHVAFCRRDREAARADLVRACTELRETIENECGSLSAARGAIYISCLGRTGALLGGPSAEMQLLQRQLGDIPLIGFFANGEIHHNRLFAQTGVLTIFT